MRISRRQFEKNCLGFAAACGLPLSVLLRLETTPALKNGFLPTANRLSGNGGGMGAGAVCLDREETEVQNKLSFCDFKFTQAKWDPERALLKMKGHGSYGSTVMLENDNTGALLGYASVDIRGQWGFKAANLRTVPCRVRARLCYQILLRNVRNAPTHCL